MQMPVFRKASNRSAQIHTQSIAGVNAKQVINTAGISMNGYHILTFINSRTVKIKAVPNENINLYRDITVLDKRIGTKTDSYPIKIPIQAVKNQDNPLVYNAHVNSSRQMER